VTIAAHRSAGAPDFTEPAPRSGSSGTGVLGELSNVLSATKRTVSGFFELLVLEGKRAGLALAWILGLGVGAAILGVTAWMGLMAALALWAVMLGLSPVLAVLLVVVLNLAAAGGAIFACIKMSKKLLFPVTRRQLKADAGTPTTAKLNDESLPAQP
jgi:hypothetical protein